MKIKCKQKQNDAAVLAKHKDMKSYCIKINSKELTVITVEVIDIHKLVKPISSFIQRPEDDFGVNSHAAWSELAHCAARATYCMR